MQTALQGKVFVTIDTINHLELIETTCSCAQPAEIKCHHLLHAWNNNYQFKAAQNDPKPTYNYPYLLLIRILDKPLMTEKHNVEKVSHENYVI